MSKGVLGLGCSYTWGEGLYYYSDIEDSKNLLSEYHMFEQSKIRKPHILYKNKHSFTNLVSQNFNTWSHIGAGNGGDNVFTFKQRITTLFQKDVFDISDFGLIIIQITDPTRNLNYSPAEQLEYIDHYCNHWESMGVKCVTLSWFGEIPSLDEYKNAFKHRHVPLVYRGETYDCFDPILRLDDTDITIASDFNKKGLQKNDLHFNLKGHRLIADLIIKKLEEDNFTL